MVTVYIGAIVLIVLLILTMTFHVLYYPGFSGVEKRWYLLTFISILISAAAEAVALYFDARGHAFALPLTVLTVIQFSITPMLPVFFVGALDMRWPAIVASTAFCLHAAAQILSAPFGWNFTMTHWEPTSGAPTTASIRRASSAAWCF